MAGVKALHPRRVYIETPSRPTIGSPLRSLGTAVAAYLATKRKSRGVILEAPFTSASAVAGKVLPWVGPILVRGYNTMAHIKNIHAPIFIVHGDRDEVISYDFGEELYAAANEPKSFWRISGATHNDLHIVGRDEFSQRLSAFYSIRE
jgi:fermentation-respiration switch protein FrsA (DUF1100 family)